MIRRILLIDDDQDDQELFHSALTEIPEMSLNLSIASDGQQALDLLNTGGFPVPDIIFLDINMPRMNGLQFLAAFRQQVVFRDVPVVVISTSASVTEIEYMLSLGARSYFVKPHSFPELIRELCNILRHYGLSA